VALARSASTIAAIEGNVETGAIRGVGNQFVGLRLDEARDPVFEIERNTE
jgi:hypothetical protein